jgi:putative ABC transport system substrate-binding protein
MDRRSFTGAIASGLFAASFVAPAQQPKRMMRVGVIFQGTALVGPPPELAQAFRAHGWIEGQTIEFQRRGAERPEELPAIAAEFVALGLDVVLVNGTPAARAMQQATSTIPIIFSVAVDPVESGLVANLARPGGNLTGIFEGLYDGRMLQLIKEVQPQARLVIYPLAKVGRDAAAAAQALGMTARGIGIAGPEEFERFFAELRGVRPDALIIPPLPWLRAHMWQRIANDLLALRLAAIGADRDFVRTGGLMSFGPKWKPSRIVAQMDKVLRGGNPAEIPVEYPTEFELAVNLKTAATIGVTVPTAVLLRADDVIRG